MTSPRDWVQDDQGVSWDRNVDMEENLQQSTTHLLVPKFMKGLGPSLHIVQIASYEEMNSITRKIT